MTYPDILDDTPFRAKLRLYVTADLTAGAVVRIGAEQTHYLANVMRARSGDSVGLFNGRDGEWQCHIQGFSKRACDIIVTESLRQQSAESDLWLLFAPIKRTHLDFLTEKATELGVSLLWPIFTRHTASSRVNVDRLRLTAIEAAEQTARISVPEVREPERLEQMFHGWAPERRLLVLDEWGGGLPIADAVANLTPGPAAVIVGPEGGFAKSELDVLRDLPFATPVCLGPRILRADTAALAALACWQALRGDWQALPVRKAP